MTSSMLAGERRWASARRGGMTVLGKVAVPKPINLPSQRLEKHGLDTNVEIVPKGSHSWGSRPSSASNPWGSSVQSPNGDCSDGSPSHAGGRPSSGGSGTRPSTAGSDRMHEPVLGAWGSNSRPSSASGALTSNQTLLTPLRPQSAETRPGSSQLSRFAEHLPDNSASWTSAANVDKSVVASKNDGFSLSSGDFPTLGSDKDNTGKNSDSQEYGSRDRPRSSSGEVAAANERTVTSESVGKGGNTNTWKRDDSQHAENGVEPNSNNWQGGYPQHFLNSNVPPPHFDAWRGPPMNSPAGVWYRGPPGGPPYGPPVAPGGFPLEPYPYYRHQMPPALGNSQPGPQQVPVAGPRGHHPKNGDFYRPQIPDGYMHPGMPIRPGFYPQPVPFDNYYGSPMGYNLNEREIPFMGRSSGPPVFNRYPAHNAADHNNTQARAGGRGPNATTSISEQVESGNSDDSRGPYKVLTKQHNNMDSHGEEGSWENMPHGNISYPEEGGQPRAALRKNKWGPESTREEMHFRRTAPGEYSSSRKFDNRGHPSNSARVMSPERIDHVERNWGTTASARSSFPEAPHVLAAPPRDPALLQKIEGLNAKTRASGGHQGVASASSREEQKNMAQFDAICNTSKNDVGIAVFCAERPDSRDTIQSSSGAPVSKGHMIRQLNAGTTNSRRGNNGVEGQFEHHGEGRLYTDADGWHKKHLGAECSAEISTTDVGHVSIARDRHHHIHAGASGMTKKSLSANNEGESLVQIFDSSDPQAQRAKNKELAKQRAIQRQKEEEERIREQKAKALAKLEELNRRSQTGDILTENLEKAQPISGNTARQEALQTLAEPVKIASENVGRNPVMASSCDIVSSTIESYPPRVPESTIVSRNLHMGTSEISEQVSTAPQSSPLRLDPVGAAASVDVKAVAWVSDSSSSMHMQTSYKKMPNIQVEKQFSESFISFGTIGLTNIHESVAADGTAISDTVPEATVPTFQSILSENSNNVRELSAAQKKKSTRSSKNKNKLESAIPVFDSQVSKQSSSDKAFLDTEKMKASQSTVDPGSVRAVEDLEQLPEQNSVIGNEFHVKVNSYRKSQPPRRMSRNGQANKVVDRSHGNDAAIWAPVQPYHGPEAADEACRKSVPDSVAVMAKNGNIGQNSMKSKRAEMERYVPKPVAKELAQQGTIQQLVSSSVGENTLNETAGRRESKFQESSQPARSVVENVGPAMESDAGDIKQGKQAKAYGGWKQHGSTEPSRAHMGSSSNSSKNTNKYVDHQESFIPDENLVISVQNISHDWDPSDGWNMPEEPTAAVNVSFEMKDVKGKGKRQPYKGHKNMAYKNDVDQRNSDGGQMYKKQIQSAALEISPPERNVTAKENRGNAERASSLWQRKPHAYSTNAQTGNRSNAGQHVSAEGGRGTRKGSSPIISDTSVTLDKNSSEVIPELHHGQSVSKNKSVQESMDVVHQEGRREKKVALAKERPQPQHKHGFGSTDEMAPPESEDTRFEQRSSSGFRKHGNQNHRSGRGQEPREDWSSVGQDGWHHNVPGNERQPRNSHYEYQPVGPHNHSKYNSFIGPTDGSHNMGPRYRERGQGQSRRGGGNPYGRKSGTVQVDADCD